MYRSRPKGDLDQRALDFLSSIQDDRPILDYDILGSEAHVLMLRNQNLLSAQELKRILQALEQARRDPSAIRTDGFEDIHEALESFVVDKAGADAGGKMHTARSRNDQVALDLRMKVRDEVNLTCIALLDLVRALLGQAKQNKETVMLFYTHLQQAQIGTLSHYFLAYAYGILRDVDRLSDAYQRLNRSPLGACAILGTSIDIDRSATAAMLGFDGIVVNSLDATSSRDVMVEVAADLAICMTSISRLSEDLIIWSSSEFGYVELDDRYSSASSAMPQKKNPDPLEIARGKAGSAAGDLVSMLAIVKSLPSGYNRDLQELKLPLFRTARSAYGTIRVIQGAVDSLRVNQKRMADSAGKSYAIALDLAEQLVSEFGTPFRTAHKIVGMLISEAVSKGNVPLKELSVKEISAALQRIDPRQTHPQAAKIYKAISLLTPTKAVSQRKSTGSPNPKEQTLMIEEIAAAEKKCRADVELRIEAVRDAYAMLEKQVGNAVKSK